MIRRNPAPPTPEEITQAIERCPPNGEMLTSLSKAIDDSMLFDCAVDMAQEGIKSGMAGVQGGVDADAVEVLAKVSAMVVASMTVGLHVGLLIGEARVKAEGACLKQ